MCTLAGRRRCRHAELRVGYRPNGVYATAGADKQCSRSQSHKRQEQGVLDQVLTLIVVQKIEEEVVKLHMFLCNTDLALNLPIVRLASTRGTITFGHEVPFRLFDQGCLRDRDRGAVARQNYGGATLEVQGASYDPEGSGEVAAAQKIQPRPPRLIDVAMHVDIRRG